ncbi:uncharacterized protein LOC123627282 [Lemur catta]|uniref:uncharacterized protein LOC123627282 n=1 Tax=Lemur catta TaxID=9447 RepID=UPI001E26AE61|nr:uncharacterized protein LOC123627282 [Lemur catta]
MPVISTALDLVSSPSWFGPILYPTRLSSVEQEEKVNGVLQSQLGEGHLTSASHRDLCDTDQPPCTGAILFDEQGVSSALDAASECSVIRERLHIVLWQLEVTATHRKDKSPWRPGSAGRRRRRIPPSRPHCMSSVSPSPVARTSLSPAALHTALLPDAGDDCACPGPAENYEEEEDEEDLESLASSVPSELQEDAGTAGLSQALTEQGFPPGGADLSDCRELIRSATSLSAEPEAESVLDGAAPTQEACPQGPWSGDLSPCVSQVQAANTQLQPSALVTDCLQLQLDQQWGRGCGCHMEPPLRPLDPHSQR